MNLQRALRFAFCSLMCGLFLGCKAPEKTVQFHSVDITGTDYAQALTLPDTQGKAFNLADQRGKVVAVFFGYTHCPDACPTSLALMADVQKQLGEAGSKLQTVLVSLDPARDSAESLRQYVNAFAPQNIALRGDEAQTQAIAKAFKVFYAKRDADKNGQNYTLDHTAGIYFIDPQGRSRLFSRPAATPSQLLDDVKLLLAGK